MTNNEKENPHKPAERARDWLERMDIAVSDCDVSLFTLFAANIYSTTERAYNKGDIAHGEMVALKESAAYKITSFLKNCECKKKIK